MTVTISQPKSKLPPVHGKARWMAVAPTRANELLADGAAWLRIVGSNGNAADYWVREIRDGGRLVGYRLTKFDREVLASDAPELAETDVYEIDLSFGGGAWVCSCPDATFRPHRPGGCRHCAGLRAALKAVGLLEE